MDMDVHTRIELGYRTMDPESLSRLLARDGGTNYIAKRPNGVPFHCSDDFDSLFKDIADYSEHHDGVFTVYRHTPDGDQPIMHFEHGMGQGAAYRPHLGEQ